MPSKLQQLFGCCIWKRDSQHVARATPKPQQQAPERSQKSALVGAARLPSKLLVLPVVPGSSSRASSTRSAAEELGAAADIHDLLDACSIPGGVDGEMRVVDFSTLQEQYDVSRHPIAVLLVQPGDDLHAGGGGYRRQCTSGVQCSEDALYSTATNLEQGELKCWYVNDAAVAFNKYHSTEDFKRRIEAQMMQGGLQHMMEALIRHCQANRPIVIRQFLPSMEAKSSAVNTRKVSQAGPLMVNSGSCRPASGSRMGPPSLILPDSGAAGRASGQRDTVRHALQTRTTATTNTTENTFVMLEVGVCLAQCKGRVCPALFLHYSPAFQQSRIALCAQLKRENLALGHIPSLVTIFSLDGRVLHQNAKSIAYMGFAQGQVPTGCGDDISDPRHPFRALFALEPSMLDDMWATMSSGHEWQGRVRMPTHVTLEPKRPKRKGSVLHSRKRSQLDLSPCQSNKGGGKPRQAGASDQLAESAQSNYWRIKPFSTSQFFEEHVTGEPLATLRQHAPEGVIRCGPTTMPTLQPAMTRPCKSPAKGAAPSAVTNAGFVAEGALSAVTGAGFGAEGALSAITDDGFGALGLAPDQTLLRGGPTEPRAPKSRASSVASRGRTAAGSDTDKCSCNGSDAGVKDFKTAVSGTLQWPATAPMATATNTTSLLSEGLAAQLQVASLSCMGPAVASSTQEVVASDQRAQQGSPARRLLPPQASSQHHIAATSFDLPSRNAAKASTDALCGQHSQQSSPSQPAQGIATASSCSPFHGAYAKLDGAREYSPARHVSQGKQPTLPVITDTSPAVSGQLPEQPWLAAVPASDSAPMPGPTASEKCDNELTCGSHTSVKPSAPVPRMVAVEPLADSMAVAVHNLSNERVPLLQRFNTARRRFSHHPVDHSTFLARDMHTSGEGFVWDDHGSNNAQNSSSSLAHMRQVVAKALKARASIDIGMLSHFARKLRRASTGSPAIMGGMLLNFTTHGTMLDSGSAELAALDSKASSQVGPQGLSKSFTVAKRVDRRMSMMCTGLPAANRVLRMANDRRLYRRRSISNFSLQCVKQLAAADASQPSTPGMQSLHSEPGDIYTSAVAQDEEEVAAEDGETDEEEQTAWFDVEASRFEDPATGDEVVLLVQTDVTQTVKAEQTMQRILDAEHALLEQVFPKHVLEVMAVDRAHQQTGNCGMPQPGAESTLVAAPSNAESLARSHKEVTILFADIVTFTNMCQELEAVCVMRFLNHLFSQFDDMVAKHDVYKVETIGDCYMVAGGLLTEDDDGTKTVKSGFVDPEHARKVFAFATDMLRIAANTALPTTGMPVQIRVGLHSGPVVSGVVGTRMPRFCLFGDTVNTASRMESTSQPGRIHVSAAAKAAIGEHPPGGGMWRPTGGVPVKGKGVMETYLYQPQSSQEQPTAAGAGVGAAGTAAASYPSAAAAAPACTAMAGMTAAPSWPSYSAANAASGSTAGVTATCTDLSKSPAGCMVRGAGEPDSGTTPARRIFTKSKSMHAYAGQDRHVRVSFSGIDGPPKEPAWSPPMYAASALGRSTSGGASMVWQDDSPRLSEVATVRSASLEPHAVLLSPATSGRLRDAGEISAAGHSDSASEGLTHSGLLRALASPTGDAGCTPNSSAVHQAAPKVPAAQHDADFGFMCPPVSSTLPIPIGDYSSSSPGSSPGDSMKALAMAAAGSFDTLTLALSSAPANTLFMQRARRGASRLGASSSSQVPVLDDDSSCPIHLSPASAMAALTDSLPSPTQQQAAGLSNDNETQHLISVTTVSMLTSDMMMADTTTHKQQAAETSSSSLGLSTHALVCLPEVLDTHRFSLDIDAPKS